MVTVAVVVVSAQWGTTLFVRQSTRVGGAQQWDPCGSGGNGCGGGNDDNGSNNNGCLSGCSLISFGASDSVHGGAVSLRFSVLAAPVHWSCRPSMG